ncbi:MAG: hypothetical protein EXR75_08490 [Myxococcales bacterium]|nr:hypothetical protein [Myxococcales bacterium]
MMHARAHVFTLRLALRLGFRLGLGLGLGLTGCVVDLAPPAPLERPTLEQFKTVSPLMEQRCGSLDCHGSLARPFRVYGVRGLRFVDILNPDQALELVDPELVRANGSYPGTGGKPTSEAEYTQNWRSACALEPEKLTQVTRGELDPDALLLLKKPLGVEGHKGAAVFIKGSSDYVCITSWLDGEVSESECALALKNP